MRYGWIEAWAAGSVRARSQGNRIPGFLGMTAVFLLAVMALGACVSVGHTPVKVTVEGELRGQAFRAERSFACEAYTRYDAGCPGCKAWRESQKHVAIPFSGESGVVVYLNEYCKRSGIALVEHLLPRFAWANDLQNPTYVERYDTYEKKFPHRVRHDAEYAVDGHPAWVSVEVREGDGGGLPPTKLDRDARWFPYGYKDQKVHGKPRVLACFLTYVKEREVWSSIHDLARMFGGGGPTRVVRTTKEVDLRITLTHEALYKKWRNHPGEPRPAPTHQVPMHLEGSYWVPDFAKRGVETCHFVGINDESLKTGRIVDGRLNYLEWRKKQKGLVAGIVVPLWEDIFTTEGRLFLFVSPSEQVLDFGRGRSLDDYEY